VGTRRAEDENQSALLNDILDGAVGGILDEPDGLCQTGRVQNAAELRLRVDGSSADEKDSQRRCAKGPHAFYYRRGLRTPVPKLTRSNSGRGTQFIILNS